MARGPFACPGFFLGGFLVLLFVCPAVFVGGDSWVIQKCPAAMLSVIGFIAYGIHSYRSLLLFLCALQYFYYTPGLPEMSSPVLFSSRLQTLQTERLKTKPPRGVAETAGYHAAADGAFLLRSVLALRCAQRRPQLSLARSLLCPTGSPPRIQRMIGKANHWLSPATLRPNLAMKAYMIPPRPCLEPAVPESVYKSLPRWSEIWL
jgi:hypothetical protein